MRNHSAGTGRNKQLKKLQHYLIYAATPGVLQVQSNCNVVYIWSGWVYVLIPQPHHQEVITGDLGKLHQLQTLQAVFRFTHRSGFIIWIFTQREIIVFTVCIMFYLLRWCYALSPMKVSYVFFSLNKWCYVTKRTLHCFFFISHQPAESNC